MRTMTFGYPGDDGLGDRLLHAVLTGAKTATSSLAVEYLSGEPLPRVGDRLQLTDHEGRTHGEVETTRVRIVPLEQVGDDVAAAEGEGYRDAAGWRAEHERFWAEVTHLVRDESGDAEWTLRPGEPVVVHWFRLVGRPRTPGRGPDSTGIGHEVVALEDELLRTAARRSPERLRELLDEAFVEFGASGRRFDRESIIAALVEDEIPLDARLSDPEVVPLAPDVLLLRYEADVEARRSLRSSVWVRGDGGWRLRFHQGTRAADPPDLR